MSLLRSPSSRISILKFMNGESKKREKMKMKMKPIEEAGGDDNSHHNQLNISREEEVVNKKVDITIDKGGSQEEGSEGDSIRVEESSADDEVIEMEEIEEKKQEIKRRGTLHIDSTELVTPSLNKSQSSTLNVKQKPAKKKQEIITIEELKEEFDGGKETDGSVASQQVEVQGDLGQMNLEISIPDQDRTLTEDEQQPLQQGNSNPKSQAEAQEPKEGDIEEVEKSKAAEDEDSDSDDIFAFIEAGAGKKTSYDVEKYGEEKQKLFEKFKEDFKNSDNFLQNYPKGQLIISAVASCVEDNNKLIKRGILDCLLGNFELCDDSFFSETQKIWLIYHVLGLLVRRDLSVTRRVYTWLFGEPDFDNNYHISEERIKVKGYLTATFKIMFTVIDKDQINKPIKILQNFYMKHRNFIAITLKEISPSFLNYIQVLKEKKILGAETIELLNKGSNRFISSVASYFHLMISQILDRIEDEKANNNLSRAEFIEKFNRIARDLEFLFQIWATKTFHSSLNEKEVFELMLLCALKASTKFKFNHIFEDYITSDPMKHKTLVRMLQLAFNIHNHIENSMYGDKHDEEELRLNDEVDMEAKEEIINPLQLEKTVITIESIFNKISVYYQRVKAEDEYVSYIDFTGKKQIIDQDLPKPLIKIYNYFVILTSRLQCYKRQSDLRAIPKWLLSLTQCIKSNEPNICNSSITALIYVISGKRTHPLYLKLREALHNQAKIEVHIAKSKESTSLSITELVIEKLWELLDFQAFHEMSISMLNEMNKFVPDIVAQSMEKTLEVRNYGKKEKAFQRFSTFWRLTTSQDEETGNVKTEKESDINRLGLFMMLDFLDDENPLLRHAARNWLIHSIPFFKKILDPVIKCLISDTVWYHSDSQQYFYANLFDTQKVYSSFRKLRNIIRSIPELFASFIINQQISEELHDYIPVLLENNRLRKDKEIYYFDLILVICLRYIQGQAVESLSYIFVGECQKVNSAACEIFELLTSRIKEKSQEIAFYVYKPLLIIEAHAIANENFVMQVQLLSLLKLVLFGKNTLGDGKKSEKMSKIFSSSLLITSIITGLYSESPYVLAQYINFVNTSLDSLCTHLSFDNIKAFVEGIMGTYNNLIVKYSKQDQAFNNKNNKSSLLHQAGPKRQIIENMDDDKDNFKIGGASAKSGLFDVSGHQKDSNMTEMNVNLVCGIEYILRYFLSLGEDRGADKLVTKGKFKLVNVITFGLFGNSRELKDAEITGFESITKSILLNMKKTLRVFCYCWKSNPLFKKMCNIYNYGTEPYNFQGFQKINANLKSVMETKSEGYLIREAIKRILKALYSSYREIILDSFIELWNSECKYRVYPPEPEEAENLGKIIEILMAIGVDVQEFLDYLVKCRKMVKVSSYYSELKRKGDFSTLSQSIADIESRLLFFLYCFASYTFLDYIEETNKRRSFLTQIWSSLIQFLKEFKNPQHPNTSCWILEVYNLFSNKYLPQDIMDTRAIRSELHKHLNGLLYHLSQIASNDFKVVFKPKKQSLCLTVLPLSPSILVGFKQNLDKFEDYTPHMKGKPPSSSKTQELYQLSNNQESALVRRYRLYTIKTLESVSMDTLKNCYAVNRVERVASRVKYFMDKIFPLLKSERSNETMTEFISLLILSVLKNSPQILVNHFQKDLRDNFLRKDFFNCNVSNLKCWKSIIGLLIEVVKVDFFSEILAKVTFSGGVFTKETTTVKNIASNLSRICFIAFSVERDDETFMNKYRLKLLTDKIKHILKNPDSHPTTISLALLCFRVLIIRLADDIMVDLFNNVWPVLLTALMKIFSGDKGYSHLTVKLEALKLLELISVRNFERFFLYQWIFVYDYFGVECKQLPEEDKGFFPAISAFQFEPYLSKTIPNELIFALKNQDQFLREGIETSSQGSGILEKRVKKRTHLIVTHKTVDDEVTLKQIAKELLDALIIENSIRSDIKKEKIEDLILNDFVEIEGELIEIVEQV